MRRHRGALRVSLSAVLGRLAVAGTVVAGSVVVGAPAGRTSLGEPPGPNILVIVTDDQRADTMSVMKATRRWFRERGRRYPRAFVTTPLCCPSRATIFTGRFVHNHGVEANSDSGFLGDHTVQRILGDEGYRTALVGKYLNGWPLGEAPPNFDNWTLPSPGYFDLTYNVDGEVGEIPGYGTDVLGSRALSYLRVFESDDQRPWFLYVAPRTPHGPYEPAPAYRDARVPEWEPSPAVLERDRTDKPPWVQAQDATVNRGRRLRTAQLRMLMSADDMVRRVMRELGRLGERDHTLAVFISDNGLFWAEHGLGGKGRPYTAAVRVPMFLRWPGRIPAGTDGRWALNADIAPTVLDAAGIPPPTDPPMDGRSLLSPSHRDHVFLEYERDVRASTPDWTSIRTENLQYVEYRDPDSGDLVYREYYDLASDPWQLTNLLGDADPRNDPPPTELASLANRLARDARCAGTAGPEACP